MLGITKEANIHCGVGKVSLSLIGSSSDYQVKAQTGLGNLRINNQKVRRKYNCRKRKYSY